MGFGDVGRGLLLLLILVLAYVSQRYWFHQAWQLKQRVRHAGWRSLLRSVWMVMLLALVASCIAWFSGLLPRTSYIIPLVGMWLSSALLSWLLIHLVKGVEWTWARARTWFTPRRLTSLFSSAPAVPAEVLENPSRRYFFQTATYLAGAVPFLGALYGFAAERLRLTTERVEVPVMSLPPALDGLRIAQLSDIHLSGYTTREQVRRAVEIANALGAELAVVTGDFITAAHDPLEDCVAELAALRAPLGVWGCLGNHEIYADVEDEATELFYKAGMRILRQQNEQLVWRGQAFNLIGVDYQRSRTPSGRRLPMLPGVERLVRRDVPNILLSHNPNALLRTPELGIELTLAGHTHGGQVNVEILDQRLNPARFMTDYIAGLYSRTSPHAPFTSNLYVNRGIGTVGAPVRVGAPPEITLLTLRRI